MFWVLDKPQCRPWDLQETDVNACAVIEKDTWHSNNIVCAFCTPHFHETCMKSWATRAQPNWLSIDCLIPLSFITSACNSAETHLWPFGFFLISSTHNVLAQAAIFPPPCEPISLGSIVHNSPPNLSTLCTLLPQSKNSGPEKTNSLLGSCTFCVLRDGLFIVHHRDGLCVKGVWRGGSLFAKLKWRHSVEVYNIQRKKIPKQTQMQDATCKTWLYDTHK